MFTMRCFVGYCAMVTSCKALFFHPLQLHRFYMKSKRRAQSHHKHWRTSEVQYINSIVWGTLREISPGVTVLIMHILTNRVSNSPHTRETPVKKLKIHRMQGNYCKNVIFHAPHHYPFLLSIRRLLCVTSVWREPGGKELHGILHIVPSSCRGTELLVNLDILLEETAHSSPSDYPGSQGKARTLQIQAEILRL